MSPIRDDIAQQLGALVKRMPDATIQEMVAALVESTGVVTSASAVGRALRRLGFSRKKRSSSQASATSRTT
ncbi:MAG TPA: hypothetical protein VFN67_07355 [Polyangiales bacterium]|jgi:transposase|nr:hypothetical protein [Polyangiales bacterium]